MQTIPLKQYMDSKRQLLNAVNNTPITLVEYEIRKYCTISIGESAEDSSIIAFKPKQRVVVEWIYTNPDNPTPTKISFNVSDMIEETSGDLFWSSKKLNKWLSRHAKAGINSGHSI